MTVAKLSSNGPMKVANDIDMPMIYLMKTRYCTADSAYSIPAYCAVPDIDRTSRSSLAGPMVDFIEHS